MKRCPGHIAALALSALVLLSSCRKDETEVIPRSELSRIYAEMLMTDQWIVNTPNVRTIADTSLVYEPILEKYGYDADDYRKSVDVYMDDPERFARILRETGEILKQRLEDLKVRKEKLEELEKLRKEAEKYRPDISWELTHPEADTTFVSLPDSLAFALDSSSWVYRLTRVARKDTVYEGVRMVVPEPDTTAVENADTVHVSPVFEKKDTLKPGSASVRQKLLMPDYTKRKDGSK